MGMLYIFFFSSNPCTFPEKRERDHLDCLRGVYDDDTDADAVVSRRSGEKAHSSSSLSSLESQGKKDDDDVMCGVPCYV